LIKDVNDQPWRADLLGRLLAGRLAHVNLIPLNPTPGSRWDASTAPVQREFLRRVREAGVPATVRDTRGRDIDGACGQLAAAEDVDGSARRLVGGTDGPARRLVGRVDGSARKLAGRVDGSARKLAGRVDGSARKLAERELMAPRGRGRKAEQ
jgi:hypothetical protein